MVTRRFVATAFAALVLGLAMGTPGQALSGENTAYLTFSGPVSLPGVSLPAGTYVFQRAIPDHDPLVVRVMSADKRTVYLTAFTKLINRPDGLPAEQRVMLGEPKPGMAPPIRAWFPSHERQGHEFKY